MSAAPYPLHIIGPSDRTPPLPQKIILVLILTVTHILLQLEERLGPIREARDPLITEAAVPQVPLRQGDQIRKGNSVR